MAVNRGFSINWQNETHQSHRGGMLHRKYPVRITHCGGSSRKSVSGTESCRERSVLPPLPSLSVSTCGSQSTSLQLILTGFVFPRRVWNGDWLAFSASQRETDVSKQCWISAFGGYSLLMTWAERLVILNTCSLSGLRHTVTHLSLVHSSSLILALREKNYYYTELICLLFAVRECVDGWFCCCCCFFFFTKCNCTINGVKHNAPAKWWRSKPLAQMLAEKGWPKHSVNTLVSVDFLRLRNKVGK